MITGFYKPEQGALWFEGQDLVPQPSYRAAQLGIARTYQIPRPYKNLTVLQNVVVGAFAAEQQNDDRAVELARQALDRVGMLAHEQVLAGGLNSLELRLMELARVLAGVKSKVNVIPLNAAPG